MQKMCALILSLSLTVAATGQQVKSLTCTGKVIDFKAQPVAGAEIVCYEGFYDYERGQKRWEVLGRAKTNKEGRFSLEVRATEQRNICVAARKNGLSLGWQGASYDITDLDYTVELTEPTVLAGTVIDEAGKGIDEAKVRVCLKNELAGGRVEASFREPEDWFTTQTDAQGKFRFDNIPPDATVDFWVEAPGKVCCWTFWETDGYAGEQFEAGRTDIRIVLGPEAKILGQVVDEDKGSPVGGIQLLARQDKGWANYYCADTAVSDSNGLFCLKGMPAGTYSLQVVPPQEKMADWAGKDVKVTVQTGQTVSDVKVPVSKGAILELNLRDDKTNQPVDGVSVNVSQKANYGRHPCYGNQS